MVFWKVLPPSSVHPADSFEILVYSSQLTGCYIPEDIIFIYKLKLSL
jgi:hypothetical protein